MSIHVRCFSPRPICTCVLAGFLVSSARFAPEGCPKRETRDRTLFGRKENRGMNPLPMDKLAKAMRQHGLIRFFEHFAEQFPNSHLKDLTVDALGPNREMTVNGHHVINFGSDSFLGLDQDPRVLAAVCRGLERWGTHNGSSRAFSSVRTNIVAEEKLANWLGTEEVLIYPSVSLANMGAIPGLVGRQDLIVVDEHAHNSIQEGTKIAQANGVRLLSFRHSDPSD